MKFKCKEDKAKATERSLMKKIQANEDSNKSQQAWQHDLPPYLIHSTSFYSRKALVHLYDRAYAMSLLAGESIDDSSSTKMQPAALACTNLRSFLSTLPL